MSQLANRFVKDPREVVKAGDIVKVKVVEFDVKRKRIALTMKLDEVAPVNRGKPSEAGRRGPISQGKPGPRTDHAPKRPAAPETSFAAAFAKLSGKN